MSLQEFVPLPDFEEYRDVSGIKFPFKITQSMGPQSFEFLVKELKVNEGVDASDFK